jgi:predicted outer membrane repeat protein
VSGTIDLQSPLPDLANTIAVNGPGAGSLTVERDAAISFSSAIFTVDAGQTASLSGLTIANGNAGGSTFCGNSASDSGGAVYNERGTATIQERTLSGNTAGANGGGIFNAASGTLAVKDSTVLGNTAPSGADLYSLGALTLDDSTVGVIGP